MKVTKMVYPEPIEAEVNVSAEDIAAALGEAPDTKIAALVGLNNCAAFFKAVTPEMIAEMNAKQREVISAWLLKEAARFDVLTESGVPA